MLSIGIGIAGGATLLRQTFDSTRVAPPNNTIGGHVDVVLALTWDLPRGVYLQTDVSGQVHVFAAEAGDETEVRAVPTVRGFFGIGKRF